MMRFWTLLFSFPFAIKFSLDSMSWTDRMMAQVEATVQLVTVQFSYASASCRLGTVLSSLT